MDDREIIEDYKKMIHGSEFDYHRRIQTIQEHEESMERAKEIILFDLRSYYKQKLLERMKDLPKDNRTSQFRQIVEEVLG